MGYKIINWTEPNDSLINTGIFINQPELARAFPLWWLDIFDKNKLLLGLKGHYYASIERLEINRIDSYNNTKYTQWEEWDTHNSDGRGWPISPENTKDESQKGKWVEVGLSQFTETAFQLEDFDQSVKEDYIEAVIDFLNFKLGKQDFKIEGWKKSDFNFIDADFVENTFTVAAGDDSVSHSYSGNGEILELYWTVDTDMQNWTIVRIGENND